ncbi:unnamed protein product [Hydatigera taeniaeformis]|uniref:Phosphorylated adapter RNA export protein n=1 Tax=Hydatigena taeniaeformis TaxID=6205 RepID=A0A0R3X387_HYDTA|nr:unnamed protein product [Hydatigera taeniaeformis]
MSLTQVIIRGAAGPSDSIDRWLMLLLRGDYHYDLDLDRSRGHVVWAIAGFLQEYVSLIDRIVEIIGVESALEFCHLTEDIENSGGLYTVDGTRRRTPCGTFLFLIRHSERVPNFEKEIIFMGPKKAVKKSETVLVSNASACLMTVGDVKDDTPRISFSFNAPPEQPVLLYTFHHFNLPTRNFNTREFCADFECQLTKRNGDLISEIKASCRDNSNPNLYGPIVTVPEATNVTCSIIWYYPEDKSLLNGSIKLMFVSAYNGDCADGPSIWNNSSSWCNVELKGLVDLEYVETHPVLCLERTVVTQVFNTTCLGYIERPPFYSPLSVIIIIICTLAFFLILLIIVLCCIRKRIARRKIRKMQKTADLRANQQRSNSNFQSGKDLRQPCEVNMNATPQNGCYFPSSNGLHKDVASEDAENADLKEAEKGETEPLNAVNINALVVRT